MQYTMGETGDWLVSTHDKGIPIVTGFVAVARKLLFSA